MDVHDKRTVRLITSYFPSSIRGLIVVIYQMVLGVADECNLSVSISGLQCRIPFQIWCCGPPKIGTGRGSGERSAGGL